LLLESKSIDNISKLSFLNHFSALEVSLDSIQKQKTLHEGGL